MSWSDACGGARVGMGGWADEARKKGASFNASVSHSTFCGRKGRRLAQLSLLGSLARGRPAHWGGLGYNPHLGLHPCGAAAPWAYARCGRPGVRAPRPAGAHARGGPWVRATESCSTALKRMRRARAQGFAYQRLEVVDARDPVAAEVKLHERFALGEWLEPAGDLHEAEYGRAGP